MCGSVNIFSGCLTKLPSCDRAQAKPTRTERFTRDLQGIKTLQRHYQEPLQYPHSNYNTKNSFIFIITFKTYFLIINVSINTIIKDQGIYRADSYTDSLCHHLYGSLHT